MKRAKVIVPRLNDEQRELVVKNQGLVYRFCLKKRPPLGMDKDEWLAEGFLQLCRVVGLWQPEKGGIANLFYLFMSKRRMQIWNEMTAKSKDFRRSSRLNEEICESLIQSPNLLPDSEADAEFCLSLLNERDRGIFIEKFTGSTYREIGQRRGMSHQRVHQVLDEGLARIRAQLKVG